MCYAEMLKDAVVQDDIAQLEFLADMVSCVTEDSDSTTIYFSDGSSIRYKEPMGLLEDAHEQC